MKRTLVALFVSLVALPALAGCLGGDEPPTSEDDELCGEQCRIDKELTEGLGKITGKIIDDAFNPIVQANVTLRELELTTKTDDQGRFAFNDLEPDTYTVFAQKPPTHKANGKQVEVIPSTVTEADIILELLPPPAQAYMSEQPPQVGLIGCSIAYGIVQGRDFCDAYDDSAKTLFDYDLDAGLTTMMAVLDSDAGPAGKQELALSIQKPVGIEGIRGTTPLPGSWEFTEETAWPSWQETGQIMTFDVRANHDASSPQIAYQQKITLYVTYFYNGEPVPDGYSPMQDG